MDAWSMPFSEVGPLLAELRRKPKRELTKEEAILVEQLAERLIASMN